MITLKNLDEATEQQVFDQVVNHLRLQNAKAEHVPGSCQYKTAGGLKCAAGCLIADDEYRAAFEGISWKTLAREGKVPKAHADLIYSMQLIHDSYEVEDWPTLLERAACQFNLTMPK